MMPKQTDSKWDHLRGWGCWVHTLLSFLDLELNVDQIEEVTRAAIAYKPVLLMKDNNVPVDNNHPDSWWRVFVENPERLIEFAGCYFNKKVNATPVDNAKEATNIGIEYIAKNGSHFASGKIDENGHVVDVYNPWPELATFGIRSLRYWKIEEIKG